MMVRSSAAIIGVAAIALACGNGEPASVAAGGQGPGCAEGQSPCGTVCVALDADPSHCGACDAACDSSQACIDGVCACPVGTTWCGGRCVDAAQDPDHCGGCGISCGAEQSCIGGSCRGGTGGAGTGGAGTGGIVPGAGGAGLAGGWATGGVGTGGVGTGGVGTGGVGTGGIGTGGVGTGGVGTTGGTAGAGNEYEGYLFVYFTGEGTANGEQVYLALSNGNDPLSWTELNGANPVLSSSRGTTGVRDPFVIRSPGGDRFFLIATDLKIYGNGDWDAVQRHGSKSIVVWESTDLVTWTDERLVQVAPDTAGNAWAPEAFYDASLGAYVVFWASKLYADSDPDHTGSTHNRMLYATTADFSVFGEPHVWKDPGYSVIDSTVIEEGGVYHRFTKDERSNAPDSPCGKFIALETSTSLTSTEWNAVAECLGQGAISQGEGPLVFQSNTEDRWYLFIDEFGGRGYTPFESTDLATGEWSPSPTYSLPTSPRHGTVLPVTAAEAQRIRDAYGGG